MGNSGIFISESSEYLTKDSIQKFNVKVIPENTLILSFKLTVGRICITKKILCTNEAIAHFNIKPNSEINTKFLFGYMSHFNFDSLGNTSSIAKAVNSKIIKSMKVLVPSNSLACLYEEKTMSIFSQISNLQDENSTLTKLRDTLLPKLLSGELDSTKTQQDVVNG